MSEGTVHPLAQPVGRMHAACGAVGGSESICIRA